MLYFESWLADDSNDQACEHALSTVTSVP